jgi:hypothetical protein
MTDTHDNIQEFLASLPQRLVVLEQGIDLKTLKEYLEYSHSFERGELTDEETLHLASLLHEEGIKDEDKRKILTMLAHLGSILAFKEIANFYENADESLKKWATIALHECRVFLESELSDENVGFISTALGGSGNKMRIYFMVLPLDGKLFSETQRNIIKEEFTLTVKEHNTLLESVDIQDHYVGFQILLPMDVALASVVEEGISKCNELGDFVYEHYYATNQNIPETEEIETIIKVVRGEIPPPPGPWESEPPADN